MFCGSVTESLPTQVPHLPQRSYGLVNRGIYMLHQLLVPPQSLKSVIQLQIPFLIRKCAHLVVTTHISLQVKQ